MRVSEMMFESFVNSDRYKARIIMRVSEMMFESFVNSDRYKALGS